MRKRIVAALIIISAFASCGNKNQFSVFTQKQTNITFENNLVKTPVLSILYYLYYYNGGGVSIGDINNDGLPDVYFTANSKGNNKLYLNKGKMKFEDITLSAGVQGLSDWCSGTTMADVNGDGWLDIYVSTVSGKYGLQGHNELYINNKNGTFSEESAKCGLNTSCYTTQATFFDYDHDGDLDCYILNQSHHPHSNIVDTTMRKGYDSATGDRLYRNDIKTTGTFTDVSKQAGIYQSNLGYGLGISVSDINNDGWEDIYIGNDFHENDYYYINNGNGTFTESGAKHFGHYSRFSMGNDVADFNNDGNLDIITLDMLPPDEKTLKTYGSDENPDIYKLKLESNGYQHQVSRNCLQLNNGDGISFSEIGLMSGVSATDWSWAPLFADFDNDGKKDFFVSSGIVKRPVDMDYVKFVSDLKNRGYDNTTRYDDSAINAMPDGASHPYLFKGDGKMAFTDVSKTWGVGKLSGYFNGTAYADLDNDGDLDLVINKINAPAIVLENNSTKNFLKINLKSDGENKFGIGTKVFLYTKAGLQYQQLMASRGFQSSCDNQLVFGVDTLKNIDSLVVIWPAGQKKEVLKNIAANQTITVEENKAAGIANKQELSFLRPAAFVDVTDSINIQWRHKENPFTDFNFQYLIPHKESTRGPKLAVGDIDNDGIEDFYVCGAKGQAGQLFKQDKTGTFTPVDTAMFSAFALCEDVDAQFLDANKDGFLDLWVVSGGNEIAMDGLSNRDRLYINDGKGHFTISPNTLPNLNENKSCVAFADIDHDGDLDAFVGFLADPMKYGVPQHSYMLINDGKGKFTPAGKEIINLLNIGMVTSASFADINKDGWEDLVVAGEFMPIKIFVNYKGKYTEAEVPKSSGIWQTLYPTDINGDGFPDFLAGNWGHNTKLWSGKNGPVKLYVKDFDGNGSIEQILCYTIDGKEYTFLAKDELERSLPVLKKYYLTYSEVAGQTVQYMFYNLFKDYVEEKAEVLGSSYLINDGKGNFTVKEMPDELQLAPVFSFVENNKGTYIAAGNFYGVIPYEGRYDALKPTMFSYNNQLRGEVKSIIPDFTSEARDMKWLTTNHGEKLLMISTNNDKIRFYKIKSS